MDRKVFWQWLRKEFQIPRDLLKISLILSVILNLALMWWVVVLVGNSNIREYEADLVTGSIGYELAKTDLQSGRPRYLQISLVEPGARATWQFEETQKIHEGLRVWEWRCTHFSPSWPLTQPQMFVDEYNRTINDLRSRNRANN